MSCEAEMEIEVLQECLSLFKMVPSRRARIAMLNWLRDRVLADIGKEIAEERRRNSL